MADFRIRTEEVERVIPEISSVNYVDQCGQKVVFSGMIGGKKYAIKFLKPAQISTVDENVLLDEVTARAQREVETMDQCRSPYLVRMGPIGLTLCTIGSERYIYYTEEFIEGKNLKDYLRDDGRMTVKEAVQLAYQISSAISELWLYSKIHRDIKPSNIIRKHDGDFVLLDMGLIFDLQDGSLSMAPVGTPLYVSPEQMDFTNRRTVMNFRSDLFSLGIVLYEMLTGKHPFRTPRDRTNWDVIGNILKMTPESPVVYCPELPSKMAEIVLRLLAKRPALRYRSIKLFQDALNLI